MTKDQPGVISVRYFRHFQGYEKVILLYGDRGGLHELNNFLTAESGTTAVYCIRNDHFELIVRKGKRSQFTMERNVATCTLSPADENRLSELIRKLEVSDHSGHQYLDLEDSNPDCDLTIILSKDEYPF